MRPWIRSYEHINISAWERLKSQKICWGSLGTLKIEKQLPSNTSNIKKLLKHYVQKHFKTDYLKTLLNTISSIFPKDSSKNPLNSLQFYIFRFLYFYIFNFNILCFPFLYFSFSYSFSLLLLIYPWVQ